MLKFRLKRSKSVTPPIPDRSTNLFGTAIGGQFGWGGTPQKEYLWDPKTNPSSSEIWSRVYRQKFV